VAEPTQLAHDLRFHASDETNTLIRSDRIARSIERCGSGMVMLVGVQSNQFPGRSTCTVIAGAGIAVAIGGSGAAGCGQRSAARCAKAAA
jgi:hypothetical protein